jgi:hypothetical protein
VPQDTLGVDAVGLHSVVICTFSFVMPGADLGPSGLADFPVYNEFVAR